MDNKELITKKLESSPYWSLLGLKVRKMEPRYAEISLEVRKELGQIFSIMHGGVAASIMDAAGAVSLFHDINIEEDSVTTVEMKINYLKPVNLNEKEITACGKVVKKGRKISVCSVEILNDSREIVALGIGTYAIVKKKKSE